MFAAKTVFGGEFNINSQTIFFLRKLTQNILTGKMREFSLEQRIWLTELTLLWHFQL